MHKTDKNIHEDTIFATESNKEWALNKIYHEIVFKNENFSISLY